MRSKERKSVDFSDCKALPDDVLRVCRKYRIVSKQEEGEGVGEDFTTVDLRKVVDAKGKALGRGPLLDPSVLQLFVTAIGNHAKRETWLDWMLFQAGGGEEARRRSAQALEQVKARFIADHTRGFRDVHGVSHAAVSEDEAAAAWNAQQSTFEEVLAVGDQFIVEKLRVFGFHRHLPGPQKCYSKIADAVSSYIKNESEVSAMNSFMSKYGMEQNCVASDPFEFPSAAALQEAAARVACFASSKQVRTDIRIETIYDDDFVTAICPLTYAAAVRYGWDNWDWANSSTFETRVGPSPSWNDPWKTTTDQNVIVYYHFKVPVPSWRKCDSRGFVRYSLENLAALLPRKLKPIEAEAVVFVGEDGVHTSFLAVSRMMADEVTRSAGTGDGELVLVPLPRVYTRLDDAEAVSRSLSRAIDATIRWNMSFDPARIVTNYAPKQ